MFYFSPLVLSCSFLLGVLLCFVPLFQIVGYESAAFSGVFLSFLSLRPLATNISRGVLHPQRSLDILLFWVQSWILILPPLLLLSLNGFRVETCAWGDGLFFWLLIPAVSMALVQSLWILGVCIHARLGWVFVVVGVVGEVCVFLWRLANEPPIARYEWLIGWFSGSIYDEALSVPDSLIVFRIYCLLCAAFFLQIAMFYIHRRGMWKLILLAVVIVSLRINGASVMFMHTHASVQEELGGRLETEHAIVYYSRNSLSNKERTLLKKDIAFRYDELRSFFKEDPVQWRGKKMEIYVYPSADEQQRLMGSRRTFVARPWTHQMHLRWREFGDSVLAHEMAHLFTAPFAPWPFRLASKGGLSIDTGLVEGIAVAADWAPNELDPHRASAALRAMKKAPDLRSLFGPGGFWSQPSGKAYTMTGSFVRWLVDTYGVESFKTLYRYGDFQEAYNKSSFVLIEEWEDFLDDLELRERDLSIAEYRYARRSIFEKVCARSLAETKRLAVLAHRDHSYALARSLYEEVLSHEPNNPRNRYAMARVLVGQKRWGEAEVWIEKSLSKKISTTYRALFMEQKGDIAWRRGDIVQAEKIYTSCLTFGLRDSQRRTILAKLRGLKDAPAKRYLLERNSRATSIYVLMDWAQEGSELSRYLVGLQLLSIFEYEGAIAFLEKITLEDVDLEEQRLFLLGKAYSLHGKKEKSQLIWDRLQSAEQVRLRMEANEWKRRDLLD